jgi:hypothetical protein
MCLAGYVMQLLKASEESRGKGFPRLEWKPVLIVGTMEQYFYRIIIR